MKKKLILLVALPIVVEILASLILTLLIWESGSTSRKRKIRESVGKRGVRHYFCLKEAVK